MPFGIYSTTSHQHISGLGVAEQPETNGCLVISGCCCPVLLMRNDIFPKGRPVQWQVAAQQTINSVQKYEPIWIPTTVRISATYCKYTSVYSALNERAPFTLH